MTELCGKICEAAEGSMIGLLMSVLSNARKIALLQVVYLSYGGGDSFVAVGIEKIVQEAMHM